MLKVFSDHNLKNDGGALPTLYAVGRALLCQGLSVFRRKGVFRTDLWGQRPDWSDL